MQRLARVRLQLLPPLKQQSPESFGVVPIGQVPSNDGVVQVLLAEERLHAKCSTFTSCHMLPPVTEADAPPTKRLIETLALLPQVVPTRQDENATPAADAQLIVVPTAPVRFSVFRSFDPTCVKKNVRFESVPESLAAKLSTITAQRCRLPGKTAHCPENSAVPICDPEACSVKSGLNQNLKGVVVTLDSYVMSPDPDAALVTISSDFVERSGTIPPFAL